ncbi:PDZ domain-containing protein [Streptomyces sp. SolWspMP-5a-2]|nr:MULTISPECIES: PDZ domain-containing protein [unclassified Streptomyces]MYQ62166.1 PDZ domain-containing protein [Streptomyces sp. SID4950]SCD31843.1 PDZ domain-containing protein [Streptomyces sp. SolWspMP-5a-2]
MEHTALRPRPMPGGERPRTTAAPGPDGSPDRRGTPEAPDPGPPSPRSHAAGGRARRLRSTLFGLCVGTVLLLTGVGLGTVGTTLLDARGRTASRPAPLPGPTGGARIAVRVTPAGAPVTLGVEVVDTERPGALIVAVHVPGPGYTAGLIRGDVVLAFGSAPVASTTDLAREVARARPGTRITLTVRHRDGAYQRLTVVPGVVV